jgi:RNA-directed DNA polymerase
MAMSDELKYFSEQALRDAADVVIERRSVAGTDRVGRLQFQRELESEIALILRKVRSGAYRFTRYRSALKIRGAGKPPRELYIPTYRDRLTLRILLKIIQDAGGEAIDRQVPNEKMRAVGDLLKSSSDASLPVARIDIKDFFSSIRHDIVRNALNAKIQSSSVIDLIMWAIRTTSQPQANACIGIPQGVSISGALADLCLAELPGIISKRSSVWLRYVDDIVIIGDDAHDAAEDVRVFLESIHLSVNPAKSAIGTLGDGWDFLGYHISPRGISVAKSSVQRLLASIARIIGKFRDRSNTYARFSLSQPQRRAILLEELNTRLTGAISRGRQYGWVMYYSESNDIALFKSIDATVRRMLSRLPEMISEIPKLRSVIRAYYEFHYNRRGGYIKNYDIIKSTDDQRNAMAIAGYASAEHLAVLSDAEVAEQYVRFLEEHLRDLERDVGITS